MNRKTISKEFENMYGNGKPLHYTTNKSINTLLKDIPNKNFENNVNIPENKMEDLEIKNFEFPYGIFIFLIIVVVLIIVLYYFKDKIMDIFKKVEDANKKTEDVIKKAEDVNIKADKNSQQMNEFIKRYEENNIKTKEEIEKVNQNKINQGGVQQLNNKIDTLSSYKQEQLVKENSYCYIGTENGQRECTNVFAGDVCMSGQIFPKMAVCINPHLRV